MDDEIRKLIAVLHEFHTVASNQRKVELEAILDQVKKGDDSWRSAEYFLANASDGLLLHFSLSIIEFWALHRWHSIPQTDRVRLRDGISQYIM